VDDCIHVPVSCINGPDLFIQMLMYVLYLCFSFRFHDQKQKDLYNLLQYTVFYGLSGIQPGFCDHLLVTFAEQIFNELNLIISYFALSY
jgi:hypothetical protein